MSLFNYDLHKKHDKSVFCLVFKKFQTMKLKYFLTPVYQVALILKSNQIWSPSKKRIRNFLWMQFDQIIIWEKKSTLWRLNLKGNYKWNDDYKNKINFQKCYASTCLKVSNEVLIMLSFLVESHLDWTCHSERFWINYCQLWELLSVSTLSCRRYTWLMEETLVVLENLLFDKSTRKLCGHPPNLLACFFFSIVLCPQ